MKVLLGHSYFLRFDPKLWRAMQPYPPLGTLYAASMLRERGHEVHLFDAMLAESTDDWQRLLTEIRPDVAVLFEDNFNYLSKMCLLSMRQAAFRMVEAACRDGYTVVVAGADVTDNAADYLQRGADYALLHEGEETLCELLDVLFDDSQPSVAGIAYLDEDGTFTKTAARQPMRDLDSLPPPARDLVPLGRYREAWRRQSRFSMNLVTARGCPYHCNWCAKPIWGQRYAVRSPAEVVEEIRQLARSGAHHLWFMDDIFGLKPGWVPAFAARLESEGLKLPFKCLSRADLLLRPGEVDALRRAGCETVWIGAESGSQSVLDAMEKGTTVEQIRQATRLLQDAGIEVAFFLQFGYPGETWADIQNTLRLVRDCRPDDIGMSVSYPLPGTPFFERVKDQLKGNRNWVDSEDMAMLYDGPYPTSFYHHLHSSLHAEFRLRKAWRRGLRSSPRQLLGAVRDAVTLPLLQGRLLFDLIRHRRKANTLPVALSREQASTPSQ
ncbi:MAG: radical SAM protein [Dehalococcoidia bacterium]